MTYCRHFIISTSVYGSSVIFVTSFSYEARYENVKSVFYLLYHLKDVIKSTSHTTGGGGSAPLPSFVSPSRYDTEFKVSESKELTTRKQLYILGA